MIELMALRAFSYAGAELKDGYRFRASPRDARTFIGMGYAVEYGEPQLEPTPIFTRKRSPVAARPAGARTRPRAAH